MSRIDRLIAEHCPDGVEYRPLGEVGKWHGGGTPSKGRRDFWEGGTIPWLSPKDMSDKFMVTTTEDHITEAAVSGSATKLLSADAVAVVVRSSILERLLPIALVRVPIALNQDMKAVITDDDVLPTFLAHLLKARGPDLLRTARKTGGSVASIDTQRLLGFRVPVPPLAVQREIANILDMFMDLEAELEAELEARRLQYTHYRDALLEFTAESDVPRRPFGDLATIVRGASPRPIQAFITEGDDGVNWIKIGDVPAGGKFITKTAERVTEAGAAKSRRVKPGDFVLSNSMSFGRPYVVAIDGCIHDGWLAIKDFEGSFVPDFLYHLLRSSAMYNEMAARAGAGTVQNLNAEIVRSLVLPVPPLREQARIAAVLDAFDALVNDLSSGLPAEIAARRTQYEHYRDRLLTFPERVA